MRAETFDLIVAKESLGLLSARELPRVAVSALEEGWDSPSLRLLAGLSDGTAGEADQLFRKALAELGIEVPSRQEAVERLARESARRILAGEVTPYQGAKAIWEVSLCVAEEPLAELDSFVYAASEWEDRPEDRRVFEEGILRAAKAIVKR